MARRRKSSEEHENHERWLVSYADFITLLFAFFVVMYSLSSVNEGKYRVLSDSLVSAFRNVTINESDNRMIVPPVILPTPNLPRPAPAVERPQRDEAQARREQQREAQVRQMHDMADEIRRALEPLTRSGQVSVSQGAHGITVEINASVLFALGDAALGAGAAAPLRAVAEVLAGADFPIKVEGHTDNAPINTFRFPSNWELSAARASSVVRLFIEAGVRADRLTAAGYSDQRPIADNASDAGRARNRRVTILIESMFSEPAPDPAPATIDADDPIRSILPTEPQPAN
ncbi:MAG: flagellar motor protein MotD [Rhodocyclaceae bacterium]|jgi:chemotaxis protein MotB|nr:flagellar motor protein MotD [Rhodocyclaceae bacterium]MCL4759023.1 flagellar motor protein MotD [Rhodocyclaceae bacterium]